MVDWLRFIPVFISQGIVITIFLFISYKILKRNRNRSTLNLSAVYIFLSAALIINIIYYPLEVNPLVSILHFIAIYFFFLSLFFLVGFELTLLITNEDYFRKKHKIIFLIFCVLLFLVLFTPEGITINQTTDWRPLWSVSLFINLLFFTLTFVIIPVILMSFKLYKNLTDENLKKRYKYYIFGTCGFFFNLYGFILYNTLQDPVLKSIWSILSLSVILWGFLVYYGIARTL